MFRVFGHENVFVLNGGLPKWLSLGFLMETNTSKEILERIENASKAVKKVYQGEEVGNVVINFLLDILYLLMENGMEILHKHG